GGDPGRGGRAVALHHDAAQPEKRRAVEGPGGEPLAEREQHRHHHHARELGERAAHEFLAYEAAHHLHDPLGRLQHHVADKAVAHHHVGFALVDPVPLDLADAVAAAHAHELTVLLPPL